MRWMDLLTLGEVEGYGRKLARHAGRSPVCHSLVTQTLACSHDLGNPVSMRSRTFQGRNMNCSTCLQDRSRTLSISPFQMIPQLRPAIDSQYCSDRRLSRAKLPAVMIRATACCDGSLWLFIKFRCRSIWETCRQDNVQRQGPSRASVQSTEYVLRFSA